MIGTMIGIRTGRHGRPTRGGLVRRDEPAPPADGSGDHAG